MSTIHYCDGCGETVTNPSSMAAVHVTYKLEPSAISGLSSGPPVAQGSGPTRTTPASFDLCTSCLDYFKANSVPTKWPRVNPPVAD